MGRLVLMMFLLVAGATITLAAGNNASCHLLKKFTSKAQALRVDKLPLSTGIMASETFCFSSFENLNLSAKDVQMIMYK